MSADELEKYRKAGRIAAEAREHGIKLVKENVSLVDIAEQIEQLIKSRGGKPAFPVNISITIRERTSHQKAKIKFRKGDVVKIDVGAHVYGYIRDTAGTMEIYCDFASVAKKGINNIGTLCWLIEGKSYLS